LEQQAPRALQAHKVQLALLEPKDPLVLSEVRVQKDQPELKAKQERLELRVQPEHKARLVLRVL
jgi:hypothetical protein